MEIRFNGQPLNPIGPVIIHIEGQPPMTVEGCKSCDRCHNRQPHHRKVLPIRPETLCDPCKETIKLIDYVTSEA